MWRPFGCPIGFENWRTSVNMTMRIASVSTRLSLFAIVLTFSSAAQAGEGLGPEQAPDPPVDFARQVAPLLTDKCVSCHNAKRTKGGLDLSTLRSMQAGGESGPAIVAGKPDESLLLDMVVSPGDGGRPEMPKEGDPLSAEQVALLKRWILEGARWPDSLVLEARTKGDTAWWSFQPLVKV